MEFYAHLDEHHSPEVLQHQLSIDSLPRFCASIDKVLENNIDRGRIYCVWGEFSVQRENINGGVRFTLPSCPNAVAWTITSGHPSDPQQTVIHFTINRPQHDQDFIDSIEIFVADWLKGLQQL